MWFRHNRKGQEDKVTRTEDLTSQIDEVKTATLTAESFITGTLQVRLNGARLQPDGNIQELSASSFRVLEAPKVGDTLLVQSEVAGPGDTISLPTVHESGIDPGRC